MLYSGLRDVLRLFPTALIGYCRYIMDLQPVELRDWKWLHTEVNAGSAQLHLGWNMHILFCVAV